MWIIGAIVVALVALVVWILIKKPFRIEFLPKGSAKREDETISNGDSEYLTSSDVDMVVDESVGNLENLMAAATRAAEIRNKILLDTDDLQLLLNASPLEVEAFLVEYDIPKMETAPGKWSVFKELVFQKLGIFD